MNQFVGIRDLLRAIEQRLGGGYNVAVGWNGQYLYISVAARPNREKRSWVMTLSREIDFDTTDQALVDEFIRGAERWAKEPVSCSS